VEWLWCMRARISWYAAVLCQQHRMVVYFEPKTDTQKVAPHILSIRISPCPTSFRPLPFGLKSSLRLLTRASLNWKLDMLASLAIIPADAWQKAHMITTISKNKGGNSLPSGTKPWWFCHRHPPARCCCHLRYATAASKPIENLMMATPQFAAVSWYWKFMENAMPKTGRSCKELLKNQRFFLGGGTN